jgi:peptidoglycan/LPS O-acetylase OafA/YrhL
MKTSLPNLQILRFLAAAMVLLSHVQHQADKMSFASQWNYSSWNGIYLAGGVDIFFVISGFIMYTISSTEFGRAGAVTKFFKRRLVRIAPPYWIFTVAMIVATVIFASHISHPILLPDNVVASFLFIPYLNAYGGAYPVLMLGWTLNYEFFFYVVFGLALFLPRRAGLGMVFVVIGAFAITGFLELFSTQPMMFWSNPIILEFLLGILLAMARERGVRISAAAGVALIVLGFVAMYALKSAGIATHFWAARILWMGLPALCICAAGVLVEQNPKPQGLRRGLVFLGDSSYALYLSHPFALNLVAVMWNKLGLSNPYFYVALSCAFSLLVGALVHVWLERPLTRYLNSKVDKPRHVDVLSAGKS